MVLCALLGGPVGPPPETAGTNIITCDLTSKVHAGHIVNMMFGPYLVDLFSAG